MNATAQHVAVKRIRDLGRPGTPGHAVELELTVSRRQVFKAIVPFLVATMMAATQNETRHEVAADNE